MVAGDDRRTPPRADSYRDLVIPEAFHGTPVPSDGPDPTDRRTALHGLGASPGVVEDRVRVVQSITGDTVVEPGEVIVCRTTDPGWVSLFAVAARRRDRHRRTDEPRSDRGPGDRIPCVIGTHDGTMVLRDGDLVRVDGTAGTVERLSAD